MNGILALITSRAVISPSLHSLLYLAILPHFHIFAERRALASEARPMIVVYSRFCNICIIINVIIIVH